MSIIAFHTNQLSIRGTEIAVYDYALYNESLLGNTSIIMTPHSSVNHNPTIIKKFSKEFKVVFYQHLDELDSLLKELSVDVFYAIKSGFYDSIQPTTVPSIIHAVFPFNIASIHGNVYTCISEWLSKESSFGRVPVLPHIVNVLTDSKTFRDSLNIPRSSTVFGGYGGSTSFDIGFVKDVVINIAKQHNDIFFIFMNFPKFCNLSNVIFMDSSTNSLVKSRFINTCDAMLHARLLGETFGLACAEFEAHGKPVFTYKYSPHRAHIDILNENSYLYGNSFGLKRMLTSYSNSNRKSIICSNYKKRFNPEAVMGIFSQLCDECLNGTKNQVKWSRLDSVYLKFYGLLGIVRLIKHLVSSNVIRFFFKIKLLVK